MNSGSKSIIAIIWTGIWVNASEFFRNEFLLKSYWVSHYRSLGITFPSGPINGMIWIAWGFLFSFTIYILTGKFGLIKTALLSWFMGFVLMWVVAWNLDVLPIAILVYAFPLSLIEAFVGAWICRRIRG